MQRVIKVQDAFTFHSEKLPETQNIIEGGILPASSLAIVGGISKMGKSVLVLNMGLCIARGKPFLGFNVPEARRVLYLQAEISEHSMQDRLKKMLFAVDYDLLPERLHIINHKGIKLDRKNDLEQISKFIEHYQVSVLIVDPLYKFHSGDENKVEHMSRFFSHLDDLVQRHKISIVVVHHFGKPQEGREGPTMFRGSSTITDIGDSYLLLQRKSKESRYHVKLSFSLRNADEPAPMILYRDPDSLWYEVEAQESSGKVSAVDCVLALEALGGFVEQKDVLIKAIVEHTGSCDKTARTALKEAEQQGMILIQKAEGKRVKSCYLPSALTQSSGKTNSGNFTTIKSLPLI